MRTILIPTDFTSTPLLLLKQALMSSNDSLEVIFMYSTFMPDSITDLLFYSPQKILQEAIPQEFREGCTIMQNKYPDKISSIRYEVFHGNSADAFQAMADLHRVERVFVAPDQPFRLQREAFNPIRYILRSSVPTERIVMHAGNRVAEKDLIAQLLTS